MAELIVTDEQARVISEANSTVPIRDGSGKVIGHTVGIAPQARNSTPASERIAEAEKRLQTDGPWFTTSEVMDHLRSLDSE